MDEKSTRSGKLSPKQHMTPWQWFYIFSRRHTWLIPSLIIVMIAMLYLIHPSESNPVHQAIFLSYPLPRRSPNIPKLYGKGVNDLAFVAFYTVVLSFIREILMQRLIRPLGTYYGIHRRHKRARFMEQVYTAMYFGILHPTD